MKLRCVLDGLLLPAMVGREELALIAWDGDESFALEALEALYYEVVSATWAEWVLLERGRYRLLQRADDFNWEPDGEKTRAAPCQEGRGLL